jgi:hypothetical protein|tara:strand:+ start:897 stop:1103 length:207 start_codon:yes stop_codon:yes gene_type:complete
MIPKRSIHNYFNPNNIAQKIQFKVANIESKLLTNKGFIIGKEDSSLSKEALSIPIINGIKKLTTQTII